MCLFNRSVAFTVLALLVALFVLFFHSYLLLFAVLALLACAVQWTIRASTSNTKANCLCTHSTMGIRIVHSSRCSYFLLFYHGTLLILAVLAYTIGWTFRSFDAMDDSITRSNALDNSCDPIVAVSLFSSLSAIVMQYSAEPFRTFLVLVLFILCCSSRTECPVIGRSSILSRKGVFSVLLVRRL
jgi:hypothetical protein